MVKLSHPKFPIKKTPYGSDSSPQPRGFFLTSIKIQTYSYSSKIALDKSLNR
jgi:hypothetical protein